MEKNERYIEALDTLIEYYQGKISELEEIKRGLQVEQKKEERTVVDVQEQYNIMTGCVEKRIKYSDGTYEYVKD